MEQVDIDDDVQEALSSDFSPEQNRTFCPESTLDWRFFVCHTRKMGIR
ncbi:hypothetical protein [Lederbergia galactosidilytica]|nr:hypothetical protein [Lederbergia galactosidilytica]